MTDLDDRIAALEAKMDGLVAEVNQRVGFMADRFDAVALEVASARRVFNEEADAIDRARREDASRIGGQFDALDAVTADISQRVDAVIGRVDAAAVRVEAQYAVIDDLTESINAKVESVVGRVDAVVAKADLTVAALGTASTEIGWQTGALMEIASKIDNVGARVTVIEHAVAPPTPNTPSN